MEKSILHKLINMIQIFYGAKMMHQYLTSIVFAFISYFIFSREIFKIFFSSFFFFLKCSKNSFFLMSNIIVNITCLVQLDGSFYSFFISNYLNPSRGLFITHAVNSYSCIDIYSYSCLHPLSNERKSMFKSGDSRAV